MKKIFKQSIIFASILSVIFGFSINPVVASPVDDACAGLSVVDSGAACDSADAKKNFNSIVAKIINVLSMIVGALSVIMIIIGGFRYVVSAGDSNGTSGAKNTILYAVVGLVVVIFAQVIVKFVLSGVN